MLTCHSCKLYHFVNQIWKTNDEELKAYASALLSKYFEDLDNNFPEELISFKKFLNSTGLKLDAGEALKMIITDQLASLFPNTCVALKIYLSLMVSNASGERAFSRLKLIKSPLRAVMSEAKLSNLAIMSMERDVLDRLPFKVILENFATKKLRKVTNMPVVVEIIGVLEQTAITKEVLESTRVGRHINELRRKTTDKNVAKRAKDLVRKWRDLITPDPAGGGGGGNGIRIPLNKGHLSPGLPARKSQPASPASRVSSLSPETRLGPSPAVSPRLPPAPALDNGTPTPRGRGRPPKPPSESAPHAPPPPAHPPRPRGRPPKNKNKHKRDASDLLPKSSPANKRLRKDSSDVEVDVESPPRVNGCIPHSQVPRSHKVKTTRELLESIQQESSLDALRNKTLSNLGVVKHAKNIPSLPKPRTEVRPVASRHASPSPARFRAATPPSPAGSDVDVEKVSGSEATPTKAVAPVRPLTVEDILAQLPPIRQEEIVWSDEDDGLDTEVEPCEVTEEDVLRLRERHIEGLNGNTTCGAPGPPDPPEGGPHGLRLPLSDEHGALPRTCPNDCTFREWHQTFSTNSYQGDLLHILPYVIID